MRRVQRALQTSGELTDEDYEYIHSHPELESFLDNVYTPSKYNTENNFRRGNNGRIYISINKGRYSAPDSTNNYKGYLYDTVPLKQQSSNTQKQQLPTKPANNLSREQHEKKATNLRRKQLFDQWTNYVKTNFPQLLGHFKTNMQNKGMKYNLDNGQYSNSEGVTFYLNNGKAYMYNNKSKTKPQEMQPSVFLKIFRR